LDDTSSPAASCAMRPRGAALDDTLHDVSCHVWYDQVVLDGVALPCCFHCAEEHCCATVASCSTVSRHVGMAYRAEFERVVLYDMFLPFQVPLRRHLGLASATPFSGVASPDHLWSQTSALTWWCCCWSRYCQCCVCCRSFFCGQGCSCGCCSAPTCASDVLPCLTVKQQQAAVLRAAAAAALAMLWLHPPRQRC